MPYLQEINGKYRVRVEVPSELRLKLGKANLTKALGTSNKREASRLAVPIIDRFMKTIDEAREWDTIHRELAAIVTPGETPQEVLRHNPALVGVCAKLDQKMDAILGVPSWKQSLPTPVSFGEMITLWAENTQAPEDGIANMKAKVGRFTAWLRNHAGHDDMARVTFKQGRDWRDAMIRKGELSGPSIANNLRLVKALFVYAFENEHISANPMARVKFNAKSESRADFALEERRLILTKARDAKAHIKWLNWVCSFHGCRTAEVADATTKDVEIDEDGIALFSITTRNRAKSQRLKTENSKRTIALHQAVLDEGFLEYVRSLPPGPLFPEVKLDHYGRRAGTITDELSVWLRQTVGITDKQKPFYSHRHTAHSILRNTLGPDGRTPLVNDDTARYILGHGAKDSHAGYGSQWHLTMKCAVEVIPNPLERS
ncbi:MAG: hypothetical protein JO007_11490 [Alphaproteobacteria bacterium]|nr:hypothetical protein [Alphaproteobacteria bacterium]